MRTIMAGLAIAATLGWGRPTRAQEAASAPKCVTAGPADTIPTVLIDSSAPARWDVATRRAIKRRQVCIGMSMDMAQQAWGRGESMQMHIPRAPGDTTIELIYPDATVILVNDSVRAIRPSKRPLKR